MEPRKKDDKTIRIKLTARASELISNEELGYLAANIGKSKGVREAVNHIVSVREGIMNFYEEGKASAWPNIESLRGYKVTLSLPCASFIECKAVSISTGRYPLLFIVDEGNVIRHTSRLDPDIKLFCLKQNVGFFSNRCIIEKDPSFTPDLGYAPKEFRYLISENSYKTDGHEDGLSYDEAVHSGIMKTVSKRKLIQQEGRRLSSFCVTSETNRPYERPAVTRRLLKHFLYKGHPLPPGMMVKKSRDTYQMFLLLENSLSRLYGQRNIDEVGIPTVLDKGGHYVLSAPYARKLIPALSRFVSESHGKVGFPSLSEAELSIIKNIKSGLVSHSAMKTRYREFIKWVIPASSTLTSSHHRRPDSEETWRGRYAYL